VRPDRGYFEISKPGTVTITDDAISRFAENPQGKHRYLILKPAMAERTREALVQLSSQPPNYPGSSQLKPIIGR